MDIHLWKGNGNSCLIQCKLDVLSQICLPFIKVFRLYEAADDEVHTAVSQRIYNNLFILFLENFISMFKQIKKHLPCFPDIGIVADSYRNINPMLRTSRIVCDGAIRERSVRQNDDTLIRRYNLRIEDREFDTSFFSVLM